MQTITATTTIDVSPLSQAEAIAAHRERWIMQLSGDVARLMLTGGDTARAYQLTRALVCAASVR